MRKEMAVVFRGGTIALLGLPLLAVAAWLLSQPSSPDSSISEGRAFLATGQLERASQWFRKAHERHPDSVEPDLGLGQVAMRRQEYGEAAAHFRAVLQKRPSHPLATTSLAFALLQSGHLAEAEAILAKGEKDHPYDPQIHELLGWTHLLSYNLPKAAEEFRKALAYQNETFGQFFSSAYAGLALTDTYQGKFSEAETTLAQGFRLARQHPSLYRALATLRASTGRFQEAHQALDRLGQENEHARERRCYVLMQEGKLEDAKQLARELLRERPVMVEASLDLALIAFKEGDDQEASAQLKLVLERRPRHILAHKGLGDLALRRGDRQEALRRYQIVLQATPAGSPLGEEVRRTLSGF